MRVLDRLEEILIATLIGAATLLIFVSVAQRYSLDLAASTMRWARGAEMEGLASFAKSSFMTIKSLNLVWAQELCIIMFVWMAKFGAAYGVRTGIHVGIDVLINRMDAARRKFFIMFGLLAGALFTGIIATMGAKFVYHVRQASSFSPDLGLPQWIVYLAIPLGSSLMCFRFLQVAWSFWQTGELPHHDHGHVDGITDDAEALADGVDPVGEAMIHSNLTPRDLTEPHKRGDIADRGR